MSFNSIPSARIHSTTINQVQWCMVTWNGPMDTFPPTVSSVLTESIPLGLPTSGICRWNVKAPWHPFTPQAQDTACLPWYLSSAIPSSIEQTVIRGEFQELESAIHELCQRYPEYSGLKPTPSELSFDSAEGFRRVSEGMLELVGFVKWWMAWLPETIYLNHRPLPRKALQTLTTCSEVRLARSGVVINLCEDWDTVNLPLWILEDIPVYYKWTSSEAADPRFVGFSPSRSSVVVTLKYPSLYLHNPEASSSSRKNIAKKDSFAVDFYLWGRRRVRLPSRVTKYSKSRIPFEVVDANGHGPSQAVFHLWRLKSDDEDDDDSYMDSDPLERPEVRRELYRFQYAPHSGRRFDCKTGILIETGSNNVEPVEARVSSEPRSQDVNSRGFDTRVTLPSRAPNGRYPSQPGDTLRRSEPRFSSSLSLSSRHRSSASRHAPSSQGYMHLSRNSSHLSRQSTPPGAREAWGSRNTNMWPDQTSWNSGDRSDSQRDSWNHDISWNIPNHSGWQDTRSRDRPSPSIWDSGNHNLIWGQSPGNNGIWQDNSRARQPSNPPSSQPTCHWGFGSAHEPSHPNHPPHPLLGARSPTRTETAPSQPQQDMPPEAASPKPNNDVPKERLTFEEYIARKKGMQSPAVVNTAHANVETGTMPEVSEGFVGRGSSASPRGKDGANGDNDACWQLMSDAPMSPLPSPLLTDGGNVNVNTTQREVQEKERDGVSCSESVLGKGQSPSLLPSTPGMDMAQSDEGQHKEERATENIEKPPFIVELASTVCAPGPEPIILALLDPSSSPPSAPLLPPATVSSSPSAISSPPLTDYEETISLGSDDEMEHFVDVLMLDLGSESDVAEPMDISASCVSDHSTWNSQYLSSGIFYFPKHEEGEGKSVEVTLRQALAVHPTWQLVDLLDHALEHCLHFRILVPVTRPLQYTPPIETNGHLGVNEDTVALVQTWKTRVTSLLNHPRGRAFAFAGGIEARIAAYIGGAAYLRRVKKGPSSSGLTFSHSLNGHVYYDDDLTTGDFDTLLGTVSPARPQKVLRTLWPSTELLASCMEGYNRHTEWNSACEALFLAVRDEVEGHNPCPRPRALWTRYIKHNPAVRQHRSDGADKSRALAIHDSFGSDWHGSQLTECAL